MTSAIMDIKEIALPDKYTSDIAADDDWVADIKAALKRKGWTQKTLAAALRVHESTVTRMLQKKAVRTGLLYKASLLCEVRVPKSLPLDLLQQKLLMSLVKARAVLSDYQAGNLVARFEELVSGVIEAVRDAEEEFYNPPGPDDEGIEPDLGQADAYLRKVLRPPRKPK